MASTANLSIYEGDDFMALVTVLNTDSTPADLTGYTVQAQVRTGPADSNPTVSAEFQCTFSGNVITVVLPHTATIALTAATYVWDLQLTDTSGWVSTLLAGAVRVTKDVTRTSTKTESVRVPLSLRKAQLPAVPAR
jgi:hypothetical protein